MLKKKLFFSVVLLFACSISASADLYVPSFIKIVTAPLPASLFLFPMIITLPIIFGISLIEAFLVRRALEPIPFFRLTFRLAVLNMLTSLIGTVCFWSGTHLWFEIPVAYISTVIMEAWILIQIKKWFPFKPSSNIWKASAKMNLGSYLAITLALVYMVHVPGWMHEDPEIKKGLQGTIAIEKAFYGFDLINLSTQSTSLSDAPWKAKDQQPRCYPGLSKTMYVLPTDSKKMLEYQFIRSKWEKRQLPLNHLPGDILAISPDGSLIACNQNNRGLIIQIKTGKIITHLSVKLAEGEFSVDNRFYISYEDDYTNCINLKTGLLKRLNTGYHTRFCPQKMLLAWPSERSDNVVIYCCNDQSTREIKLPGSYHNGLVFSPDGKYLAYLSSINPYTYESWYPDLCIISVDGKHSATLYSGIYANSIPCMLYWVP